MTTDPQPTEPTAPQSQSMQPTSATADESAYIGEIRMFAGSLNFLPSGWMLCNGASLQIAQYSVLFAVIGNYFGGNSVTFNLPDLRDRTPLGTGTSAFGDTYPIGEADGAATVALQISNLPMHAHTVMGSTDPATVWSPTNGVLAAGTSGALPYRTTTANTTMNSATIGVAGGMAAHNNLQPYVALNFIINYSGNWPSQY